MTPKEKAKELVFKMWDSTPEDFNKNKELIEDNYYGILESKNEATICVDEILEVIYSFGECFYDDFKTNKTVYSKDINPSKYWIEVRNEIEKL